MELLDPGLPIAALILALSCATFGAAAEHSAAASPSPWRPLAPLSGTPAIGSPGGTHSLITDGNTVHAVWAQAGRIQYRRSADRGVTWGHAVPLTSGHTAQYPCSLELSPSALHLIWPDSRNGKWELFHKRSTDGGNTWGPDTLLTPGVDLFRMGTAISDTTYRQRPAGSRQDGGGTMYRQRPAGSRQDGGGTTIHIVWGSKAAVVPTPAGTHTWGELYYKRSTDDGKTWEPIARLTQPQASAMRPAIAASGNYVHVAWFDRRDSKDIWDWEVYTKRSTDGGATWEPDVRMTNTPTHTRHPQIVAMPGGRVCCIWEDGQVFDGKKWGGDAALYAALSDDNGRTWKPSRRITSINAPNEWATHSKAYACGSRIHLAWADSPEGVHHPHAAYYMTSPDGGVTWEPPERLTAPSDGAAWAQAVAGTESYAVAVISLGDTLHYRRREMNGR
jgi:hypothetical protein